MIEQPTRRGLITGLIALVAAPAIVRVTSLMPIKVLTPDYRNNPVAFVERFMQLELEPWQREWLEVAQFILPQPARYISEQYNALPSP